MRAFRHWWLAVLVVVGLAGVVLAGRALAPTPQVSKGDPAWSAGTTVAASLRDGPAIVLLNQPMGRRHGMH